MSDAQKDDAGTAAIAANGRIDRNVRRIHCCGCGGEVLWWRDAHREVRWYANVSHFVPDFSEE